MSRDVGVPRGRLNFAHDDETLDLFTIQHCDVVNELNACGSVRPDLSFSAYFDTPMFARAYRWMSSALDERRDVCQGFDPDGGSMFWFWAGISRADLVSDARAFGPGHVLLRCRIARSRVLLSDFDSYHAAFCGSLVYSQEEVDRSWELLNDDVPVSDLEHEIECKYGREWNFEDLDPALAGRVRDTWVHMLRDDPARGVVTQACVSDLRVTDVTGSYNLFPES